MDIEDIILDRDRRGISGLRSYLPSRFCDQTAEFILKHPGTVIITTGFYIRTAGAAETDGPAGAVVMGNALQALGYEVVHVTDKYTTGIMTGTVGSNQAVVDFPITDEEASKKFANDLLKDTKPSIVIAIERCGFTDEGLFRNMRGLDITEFNAKTDYLVTGHPYTVGIGDGGNEIGMGNLANEVTTIPSLVKIPCVTPVSKLVISSVSNWGGYGLVTSLSKLKSQNLLPSVEEEQEILKRTVELGAVDGMSGKNELTVDLFTMEENSQTIVELQTHLAQHDIQ